MNDPWIGAKDLSGNNVIKYDFDGDATISSSSSIWDSYNYYEPRHDHGDCAFFEVHKPGQDPALALGSCGQSRPYVCEKYP